MENLFKSLVELYVANKQQLIAICNGDQFLFKRNSNNLVLLNLKLKLITFNNTTAPQIKVI